MANSSSVLRIRQVRSNIGQSKKQREALLTLGLRRIGQVVEQPDNPAVRGNVVVVNHLVRIEPVEDAKAKKKTTKKAAKDEASAEEKPAKKKTAKKAAAKSTAAKTTKKSAAKKAATKKKTSKKKASGESS